MAFDRNGNFVTASELTNQNGDLRLNDQLQDIKTIQANRSTFSADGQYKVDNLSYPEDLLSANSFPKHNRTGNTEYGSNYVIFYINVNNASKLIEEDKVETVNVELSNANKERLIGKNISSTEAIAAAGLQGAAVGVGLGGLFSGSFKGAGSAGVLAGGTSAVSVGAVSATTGNFSRQLKRLTAAIALNEPNQFLTRYSANWEEDATAGFQAALLGAETLGKAFSEATKGDLSDAIKALIPGQGAAAVAGNLSLSSQNVAGQNAISNISGLAANPKKEQIFKGVDFRTFTFDYQFFPRSRTELQNVQNIIYLFKLHMHPEFKTTNNFLYLYPSEFDIVHYHGFEENIHLPKHTSCILTEMVVNYAPQSQFTTFEGGAPTQINMTLTFKELSQMTKERIQEGH